jgi:hypothetical protein
MFPRNSRRALSAALCGLLLTAPCFAGTLGLLRVTGSSGNQPSSNLLEPAIADSALVIAYSTTARNLGLDHGTGSAQIFVQDAATNALELASVSSAGQPGLGNSVQPSLSADARYVAFASFAGNLVGGPSPGMLSVYRRDRQSGTTLRVTNGIGATANGQARFPVLSGNGRFVAYYSSASNLVSGDSNGLADLFLTDMQSGSTERLSLADSGLQSANGALENWMPMLSADARYAVFASSSTNLVTTPATGSGQIYLRDRQLQRTQMLSINGQGQAGSNSSDVPSISANGRYVAFRSFATNLIAGPHSGLFRLDRSSGALIALPLPASGFACSVPAVNNLGEVSYVCSDPNSTIQAWLFRPPATLFNLSEANTGGVSNGNVSGAHALGSGGRLMAYSSTATNIVSGDTNGFTDLFLLVDIERLSLLFADGFE